MPVASPSLFAAMRDQGRPAAEPVPSRGVLSDAQIIAVARESPAAAFELIYTTFKGRLYTFLLRLVAEPEVADDLTHDVFAKALKLLPSLTAEHKVLPWLYRVAHNAAIDHLRRKRRIRWLSTLALVGTRREPRADAADAGIPEHAHVQAVLRTLPPENASALLLHALEGYSYAEIAEIQGVTMTAVRSRIARARKAFKERYSSTE